MYDFYIGDPAAQIDDYIHQDLADNCAVAAETSLINQFIGGGLALEDATYISASNGWYESGGGTMPNEIGNLMNIYDVPNHSVINASVEQLVRELQNGNGVIVGVNSYELWDEGIWNDIKQFFYDAFGLDTANLNPANHAVVVTGVDISNPETPMVILNDSGTPDGAAVHYPLRQFADAWENSGCYYTATDLPLPGSSSPNDLGFDLGEFLKIVVPMVAPILIDMTIDAITEADWEQLLA
jgi:hypothetical protein